MVNRRTPIPKNSSAGSKVGRCLAGREERGGGALRAGRPRRRNRIRERALACLAPECASAQ